MKTAINLIRIGAFLLFSQAVMATPQQLLTDLQHMRLAATNAITNLFIQLIITSLFSLAPILVIDKKLGVLEALKQSYDQMKQLKRWLKLFMALIAITILTLILATPSIMGAYYNYPIITLLGAIIMVIYIIYMIPWMLTVYGLVYHHVIDD